MNDDMPFTFIPPDARGCYLTVLRKALDNDMFDDGQVPGGDDNPQPATPLSKQSVEVLNEVAYRWRIPQYSRLVLFLEAIRQKFQNREISVETLDTALTFIKDPPAESKHSKQTHILQEAPPDPSKWTITDYGQKQQVLLSLHDNLLRELFDLLQHCYENKPPSIGPVMFVLENHVYDDPMFAKGPEDLDEFSESLREALRQRAHDTYSGMLGKHVPEDADSWEFYHVIQLGKAVVALSDKIQKRYRKNPEVMGVKPLSILVETLFPSFAADARDLVSRTMDLARDRDEEVPIQDGFDLYKELVEIRRIHAQALPEVEFGFHIEELLSDFVWRWIAMTDEKIVGWIEEAVKHDTFVTRPEHQGDIPSDEERHSISAVDMFRSISQTVDGITKLEWDDDFQYAKFMTAISKSIGDAIARYCELLEQKFIKEMDRLTPEQELAARQTRQEKWVQMARDAVTAKEKAEPYQFLPEVSTLLYVEEPPTDLHE